MRRFLLLLILFLITYGVFAQDFLVSGYVKAKDSGEQLPAAIVTILETGQGVVTNAYGYYALKLPKGTYTLVARYAGYKDDTVRIVLKGPQKVDFQLEVQGIQLEEVVIEENYAEEVVKRAELGHVDVNVEQVKTMPLIFGEADVLKVAQLKPGIQVADEGTSGFFVRGGRFDQNLILLDEATVYNASHLFGFFSVFNTDALKSIDVYKGNMPAQYGGRLSSVMDIRMREGNRNQFHVSGGIGLIASRLTVEGPIIKNKASFLVTGRRTYADFFLRFSNNESLRNNQLYFYDLNMKVNMDFSDQDRVFLSGYFGRDVFNFGRNSLAWYWQNRTFTARWNHLFSTRVFVNTSFIFNDYRYGFNLSRADENLEFLLGVRDYTLKVDGDYFLSNDVHFKFGGIATYHYFQPGELRPTREPTNITPQEIDPRHAMEYAVYANIESNLSPRLQVNGGLRFSWFTLYGPLNLYQFLNPTDVTPIDTEYVGPREPVVTYSGLEPRVAFRYLLTDESSLKGAYTRNYQYLLVATYSSIGTPSDIWLPSSRDLPPQYGDQVSLGYSRTLLGEKVVLTIEGYYKWMYNQIDFRPGADIYLNPYFEHEVLVGKGWSYGVEFLLEKRRGKWSGWLSYTYSRTKYQIEGINEGDPYSPFSDRPHDVSIVVQRQLGERWLVSAVWVYLTGRPVTMPVGKYEFDQYIVGIYTKRGNYRLQDYHRLDLSVNYLLKQTDKVKMDLNLSIYNAYMRKNTWAIMLERDEQDPNRVVAKKIYLFSIVPALTWNFQF